VPKAYARDKGSEIQIGNYGTATYDRAAVVPPAVAEELARNPRVRVERDDEPAVAPPKKKPTPEPTAFEAGKE
jgi:hypothetical protein